jgi:hypothetical protein
MTPERAVNPLRRVSRGVLADQPVVPVSDIGAALNFYEELMPALGFTERYHGVDWKVWATTDQLPSTAYFAVTEALDHAPNENRIAFWAASVEEVDRVAKIARRAEGRRSQWTEADAVRAGLPLSSS